MANQAFFPLYPQNDLRLIPEANYDQSLLGSLASNLKAVLFPVRNSAVGLTAHPVRVREIWGDYQFQRRTIAWALALQGAVIGAMFVAAMWPHAKPAVQPQQQVVDLVAPDISTYEPVVKPTDMGGGGGGGDHDKLQAPKGKLPKVAPQQITPPAIVVRNDNPKLAIQPTVVMPPTVKLAASNLPVIGVPESKISGPASNGIGSEAGIGSGEGGGVGSGIGAGVGPGEGGGFGGGIYQIGGGVSAPRPIYSPDPDYTEEARKAKYEGTCVLWLIVGPDGKPRDVRVTRTLGMGLDQKAIEAVKQWRFQPATKDGKPVAVEMSVDVSFRLY